MTTLGRFSGGEQYYLNKPSLDLGGLSYNGLKEEIENHRGYSPHMEKKPPLPPTARRDLSIGKYLPAEGATARDPYPVSPAFDDSIRLAARMLAAKNIPLLIRLTPVLQGANAEHFDRIQAWLDQLESDYPNVVGDRPEVMQYGPECFMDDRDHFNLSGSEKFTDLLASRVTRLLSLGVDRYRAHSGVGQAVSGIGSTAE